MAPKFGTSGLRGLVTELTPDVVAAHVHAFIRACETGTGLFVGRDLRDSSPALAAAVIAAARARGLAVTDCGAVPTPALALVAMRAQAAAVMVTGSHIPADRNGLKFYTPRGEISKAGEAAILAALASGGAEAGTGAAPGDPAPVACAAAETERAYLSRILDAWGPGALAGMRIGVWSHSAVGRDLLLEALAALGAAVEEFGRSDRFVPVDTEAVDTETRAMLAAAARAHGLDAIVSTDGDGDRPLLADADGRIVPGDVAGQIAAAALGADHVVTPVSSNGGVEAGGRFARVIRTRIGSPHVIAAMEALLAADPAARVAGYEANGGFLLGFAARGPAGPLPPLMTRDSLLPLVAALAEARKAGSLARRVAAEPPRFTAADRLQEVPSEAGAALIARLDTGSALAGFVASLGARLVSTDRTDGLRARLDGERVLHLRPSGNAPEMRVYTEAKDTESAEALLKAARVALRTALDRG